MSAKTRTTVRRHPERGRYDRATIDAILDEALVCHAGFQDEGRPFVIPMIHARAGDTLYLHGSPASRMLRALRRNGDVCVTATIVDGLVLARSLYHHSLNSRSVVVTGRAREVTARDEKLAALEAVVEHVVPGRSREARAPTEKELAATLVVAVPLAEASAKIRTGPPIDFDADVRLPIWAGVIPLSARAGPPEPEPRVPPELSVPEHVAQYARPS
jgi:uncharacterized protein